MFRKRIIKEDSEESKQESTPPLQLRYLEALEFDPALRHSWLNFFVTRFRVVLLLIVLISAGGIYAYRALPRESNPEVKIPVILVTTVFPGASPADVEELVTKKLETEIATLRGIKQLTSHSANSFSSINVEFEANANLETALREVRDKIDTAARELPDDAEDPEASEISFDDQPILTFAISGPYDGFVLRQYAEDLQEELEKIADVREVRLSGGDETEFSVAYDPGKLAVYHISTTEANQAIAATNTAVPGGNFEGREFNYPVRTDTRFFDAAALGAVPVTHTDSGAVVYLRDIATIEERAVKRTVLSRLSIHGAETESSVTIDIVKKTGGNVLEMVAAAKAVMEDRVSTFPEGMRYAVTLDFAEQIDEDFTRLSHDFLLTLLLVMGTLLLIVGLKEALIAGLAIPLVFFVTFGVMLLTGTSLNFLSLFSLLLSLGLLVDDAIVVVSATKQYLSTGKFTPEEAVLLVLRDFKVVLTTTTLATTWAFLPLLMATGIIGQFIKSIPITVSVTLVASLLIALMINHPLAAVLERVRLTKGLFFFMLLGLLGASVLSIMQWTTLWMFVGALGFGLLAALLQWYFRQGGKTLLRENATLMERERLDDTLIKEKLRGQSDRAEHSFGERLMHGIVHFDRFIPPYERWLRQALATRRSRTITLVSTMVLFVLAVMLPVTGIVKTEFFPPSDEDLLFVNITGPVGWRVEETDRVTRQVESKLLSYQEIENFSTLVGRPGISPNEGTGAALGGLATHRASIVIKLAKPSERDIASYDLAPQVQKEMEEIEGADVKVEALAGGPPAGAAFEARIIGDDLETLDVIATEFRDILTAIPNVSNPDISLKPAPADYTFRLDPAKLELYDMNTLSVSSALRLAVTGTEVSTVLRDNDEIDVVARFDESKITTLEALQNLQILNDNDQPVALKNVATIELVPSLDSITRIDQKRAVVLNAGVVGETPPAEILAAFQEKIKDYALPDGYAIQYGGENEENEASVQSILRAMIIAAFLIIATMIIQFNSLRQAGIVLVTLPLALIGVFVGLAIFQVPLSFPGLIGILALFGIVVKNAIILIDTINLNLKSGIPFEESIVDAGKARLEAIFITSLCTIFGILPITLSDELWRALGSAVIFGLSLSSFLTLFVVPVLFAVLMKPKENTL